MLRALGYAHRYNISRFWVRRPIILTHFLTSRCNCRCRICDIWRKKDNPDEMKTDEVKRMLDQARGLNFIAYLAWGGEPLMRPDFIEIMKHAHDIGLYTSFVTNGTLLAEKAEEISKAVDLTWVSLDHDTDYHDEMRGLKGVFVRATEGISKLRDAGGRVAINCVLSRMNTDSPWKMAELARKLDVLLAFDPMEVFPGFNDEHALTQREISRLFTEVYGLKRAGYAILNTYDYIDNLTKGRSYSCVQPNIFINVQGDGKISPFWCRKSDRVLGDLRKDRLEDILLSTSFKNFRETTRDCNLCSNSANVESSLFYSVRNFLTNCLRVPSPVLRFILDYGF